MRNFGTNKYCFKKNIFYPIFMNKGVGLRNENHCFLHQFGALFLREAFEILPKSLIHCVIAGLTRNLILAPSDVTRYVSTSWIGWDAGSSPARHEQA